MYFPALLVVYVTLAIVFAIWRTSVVNWDVWFGPLAWTGDMFALVTTTLFFSIMWRSDLPVSPPKQVVDTTVDILIPTANEPLSVLEPTVLGAINVRGVRSVLVLDDGNRDEVRQMAERLGARYFARTGREGAKAGNLNAGLAHTDAELIATFDADHIPLPEFLEQTVGYFDDVQLGFLQTPQSFYNTDSITFRRRRGAEDGWHEQEMFYGGVQPAKNRSNSAFFTGTGAVLRRAALDSVGGFATGISTEDIHTSIRLHANGWRSLYLPTPLAYGLEVDNLREFYRTRRRWAAGSMSLLFRHPDSPLRIRGLSMRQRMNYLSATLAHLQGGHRLIFLLTPVLAVTTGQSPVAGSFGLFSAGFGGYMVLSIWITHQYSRGHFHPLHSEVFSFAATVPMIAGLRGALRMERTFDVSDKRASRATGRSGVALKFVYWAVAAVCAVAMARAVQLLVLGQQQGLAGWAAVFLAIDLVVLLVFLIGVQRYERRAARSPYAELAPAALYGYVREMAGSVAVAQAR